MAWPEYGAPSDFGELEKTIKVLVLVLRGDMDFEQELIGPLGQMQGWKSVTLVDCGHLVPPEHPAPLADHVEASLKMLRYSDAWSI